MIDYLCSRGADINIRSANDDTPLMSAAGQRKKEAMDYLVKAGADVSLLKSGGATVLDIALKQKSFK